MGNRLLRYQNQSLLKEEKTGLRGKKEEGKRASVDVYYVTDE